MPKPNASSRSSVMSDPDTECPTCGRSFGNDRGVTTHIQMSDGCSYPWEDESALLDYYIGAGMEIGEIADIYGCHLDTISEQLDEYDIKKPWKRRAVLEKMYCIERMPSRVIGERLGCSYKTVLEWLEKHGIARRGNIETTVYGHKSKEPNTDCDNCGRLFYKPPAQKARRDSHYCKRSCWKESGGEVIPCDNCGREFYQPNSQLERNDHNYCLRGCFWEARRRKLWADEQEKYRSILRNAPGLNWEVAKRRARKRAGNKCESCGTSPTENGRALDVHHIVPVLAGGTNYLENLMVFCIGCHRTAEMHTRDLFAPVF